MAQFSPYPTSGMDQFHVVSEGDCHFPFLHWNHRLCWGGCRVRRTVLTVNCDRHLPAFFIMRQPMHWQLGTTHVEWGWVISLIECRLVVAVIEATSCTSAVATSMLHCLITMRQGCNNGSGDFVRTDSTTALGHIYVGMLHLWCAVWSFVICY